MLSDVIPPFDPNAAMALRDIYRAIEQALPHCVDDEPDPPPSHGLRWQHELRWELETLVTTGEVLRRKDLGRGLYSLSP